MKDKHLDKTIITLILIFGLILFCMMSLWAIDISVSAMLSGTTEQPMFLTNGFWDLDPMRLYHAGLWLLTISIFLLSSIGGYFLLVAYKRLKNDG